MSQLCGLFDAAKRLTHEGLLRWNKVDTDTFACNVNNDIKLLLEQMDTEEYRFSVEDNRREPLPTLDESGSYEGSMGDFYADLEDALQVNQLNDIEAGPRLTYVSDTLAAIASAAEKTREEDANEPAEPADD